MSQKRQQGTISTQEEKRSSLPDLNPLDPMREVRVQERDASVEDGLPEEEEADGGSNDPRAEVLGEDAAGGDYEAGERASAEDDDDISDETRKRRLTDHRDEEGHHQSLPSGISERLGGRNGTAKHRPEARSQLEFERAERRKGPLRRTHFDHLSHESVRSPMISMTGRPCWSRSF